MPSAHTDTRSIETLADLVERLGGVPLERIRMRPPPGAATEQDLVRSDGARDGLCELADGVLVEKPMGYYESRLAAVLIGFLEAFLQTQDLGIVLGPDGALRLMAGLVRLPDVSFLSWDHFPGRLLPKGQVLGRAPDLAVEILSPKNTVAEMARKRAEYFAAGTRLHWELDPDTRVVTVYASPDVASVLDETHTLNGGLVLPGFSLPIRTWFARAGQRAG